MTERGWRRGGAEKSAPHRRTSMHFDLVSDIVSCEKMSTGHLLLAIDPHPPEVRTKHDS